MPGAVSIADTTAPPLPAVAILSAEKTYPNGVQALQPVDLKIAPGEFVTLIGPSGCGKSTLLKMIAGLHAPSDGRILLWQKPVHQLAETGKGMDFVFQAPTLMPWASVRRNVRLPLELAGVDLAQANARVDEVLKLVGLEKFDQTLPRALSGGMQMRVSIARGLVTKPDLLLMDEPFGALDEITRHRLDSDLLALWKERQLTVVFVTHSIQEAVFLSTRVVVMAARPGRVVAQISIEEPYPRNADFMVSERFAKLSQKLQQSLLFASQAGEPSVPA